MFFSLKETLREIYLFSKKGRQEKSWIISLKRLGISLSSGVGMIKRDHLIPLGFFIIK